MDIERFVYFGGNLLPSLLNTQRGARKFQAFFFNPGVQPNPQVK